MSQTHTIRNLTTLVDLRSTEVERLQSDMAAQTAVRERYQKNLERLTGLYTGSGASGALPLALSVNCGDFKQAVMQLADQHRTDLHLHVANMAISQRALNAAWAKREVLDQVLTRKQKDVANEQQRRDAKRQDELATQFWFRGQVK
ncbi:flagellar FliJ family protein [Janthinobacterium agaricidamnosum]|uniref:Flagellar FliJ protein n=1 Tax=Janthinobacterium agaricidamnosum NBRC 102515 = DSM 9628 TaxID=1349767 RepID=W0V5M8_9BURK|nr:flagellar FliJ family protein [Janthinobacterium agaricidamnosum]CDG82562.1 flagellar export protein FliJ [Janthinobacterium agaricidamnosum NBRC 102515 = DSM 9628]